jgi:hypothetical protein
MFNHDSPSNQIILLTQELSTSVGIVDIQVRVDFTGNLLHVLQRRGGHKMNKIFVSTLVSVSCLG